MSKTYRPGRWPSDTDERIRRMRSEGASWEKIGVTFKVSISTIRNRAIRLGLFAPRKNRRFTAEDDRLLREDYLANRDLEVTAAQIGCSYGVLCQRIIHYHRDLIESGVRSSSGTMALKRYGVELLSHGATAEEAAKNLREKLVQAKAVAKAAAINARVNRAEAIIKAMVEAIAAGKPRDEAVFEARSYGVTLERIAECFDITRERVRQICDQEAFRRAIHQQTTEAPEPPKPNFLIVKGGVA